MKKLIALSLALVMCLSLTACGGGGLNGTYVDESGVFTIEFEKDGSCTLYQDGLFFEGTYQKNDSGWTLNIFGGGYYDNTSFHAEKSGETLIISGGAIHDRIFFKQH